MIFCHGFGTDQLTWRFIYPAFEKKYRIILFDFVGSLSSNPENFDIQRYRKFQDYADDLITICYSLNIEQATLITHSASCMIGTLAAIKCPDFFKQLIFISGSPRYINDGEYIGGFTTEKVTQILASITENYSYWIKANAPIVVNCPDKPSLVEEFSQCLLKLRPDIALVSFSMIIQSDHRQDVAKLDKPVLILQPQDDIFVPLQVGEYLHRIIKKSDIYLISTKGHFPHLTNPTEIIQAITDYLQ